MIKDMHACWLYAYAPTAGSQINAYFTIFCVQVGTPERAWPPACATVSLSFLTNLPERGAGAGIKGFVATPDGAGNPPPFTNLMFFQGLGSITYALAASGAQAFAHGELFLFGPG